MEQLGLLLANRLSYSSKNFFEHAGVKECFQNSLAALNSPLFSICYITGAPRYGKTHLSIKLSDTLMADEYLPKFVEGEEFASWLTTQFPKSTFTSLDRIIIDDADKYFASIKPGASGPFVNFIETLRRASAGVVLLSRTPIEELPCDEHVKSRLLPGEGYQLTSPSEEDTETLVRLMAEQRGIKLKERKVGFLVRRLRKDIPSIEDYFERVMHLSRVFGQRIQYPLLNDAI